jgi:ribosomal protein S18 acetylase RimI-like enzyme
VLEVKASNEGAVSLYNKLGFDEVGRRCRYYSNGEDALLLQKEL